MTDVAALFRATTAPVADIVATEPDPSVSTPCADWSYGQLLGHVVGGDHLFTAVLEGAGPNGHPHSDQVPTVEDYRQGAARLADLFEDPAVRTGTYEVPVGSLDGTQVTLLRSVEHLLHGWDLAKAAGAPTAGLVPAAAALEGPAHHLLAAVGPMTLGERRPFAEAVPTGADAGVLERLVAAFGRDPAWRPAPGDSYAGLLERFAEREDVELPDGSRRGYGAEGMRLNGLVFACPHQGRLMLKLPEPEVNELIAAGLGQPLAKPGQRPMREWVLVPFDGAAAARTERAYAFARRAP